MSKDSDSFLMACLVSWMELPFPGNERVRVPDGASIRQARSNRSLISASSCHNIFPLPRARILAKLLFCDAGPRWADKPCSQLA